MVDKVNPKVDSKTGKNYNVLGVICIDLNFVVKLTELQALSSGGYSKFTSD